MTETQKRKRERSENWTEQEKRILIHLVEPQIDIIDAKKTDTKTNRKKQLAWGHIEERFELMNDGVKRPKAKLRAQWKRMKAMARQKKREYKKSQRAAGGGINRVVKIENDWKIRSVSSNEVEKDVNGSDSDGDESENTDDSNENDSNENKRKRERSENWTEQERQILISLVEPRIHILDAKQTDTNTNRKKHLEWGHIEERFELMTDGVKRSRVQLKAQWKRLKELARKKKLEYEKSQTTTGGGKDKVMTETDWKIISLSSNELKKDVNGSVSDGDESESIDDNNENTHATMESDVHKSLTEINVARKEKLDYKKSQTATEGGIDKVMTDTDWKIISLSSNKVKQEVNGSDSDGDESENSDDSHENTRVPSPATTESDVHKSLIERKLEELDLKIKHMKKIHKLEIEQQKLQLKNLELQKLKLELEIKHFTKKHL